jgi:hypothetical protein
MNSLKNKTSWVPFLGLLFMLFISPTFSWAQFAKPLETSSAKPGSSREDSNQNFPKLEMKLSPEGVVRKLNLQSDRMGLQKGFGITQRSGTESGGGGSGDRDRFYSVMRKSIEILKLQTSFEFSGSALIFPTKLEDALRASTVIPTHKKLHDQEGAPVDLINDPQDLVIWFNVENWSQLPLAKQVQLGLHELLGLLEIPDPLYKYSEQLQLYVIKNWNKESTQRHVIQKIVSKKKLLELMQEAELSRQDVVLSLQCEKYSSTHKGFCLIRSVIQDGKPQEIVYLIDGSVDDFKRGIINSSKKSFTVFTDIHPQNLVQMEGWIEFSQGISTRWSESECKSHGFNTDPGTWCLYAEYAEEN